MSIKIEVTGNSLAEVADKLLALAGQFQTTPWVEAAPGGDAAPAAEKAKPTRKTKTAEKPAAEPEKDDAGNAASEDTDAAGEKSEASTAGTSTSGETTTTSSTATSTASPSEALDFDKDVAPVVIEAVQRTNRDAVSELLSEFGATRASEVAETQWQELVDRLKVLGA